MKHINQNFLSKPELQFWVPIIISIVGMAITVTVWGFRLENKEDHNYTSLKDGQDQIIQLVNGQVTKNEHLTTALNCLENDVSILDNIHGIIKCK